MSVKRFLQVRDKEVQGYLATIAHLEKAHQQMRMRLEDSDGHKRYQEMRDRLKDAELRNLELSRLVKSMERISNGQGKALERIVNEKDYPTQIKALQEQLRLVREKNKELDERLRREERSTIALQDRCVSFE